MLRDIFRETFVAQDFLAEGMEKGMEKGVAAERMNLLVGLVGEKFPELVPLAEERCAELIHLPNFPHFLATLITAREEQEARQLLMNSGKK